MMVRTFHLRIALSLAVLFWSAGCSDDEEGTIDSGTLPGMDASVGRDANVSPPHDAAVADGGFSDSGFVNDGSTADASAIDSGSQDSGVTHGGSGCSSAFDCTSASAPRCDPGSGTCVPGPSDCLQDDPAEDGDDGPAGATVAAAPTVGNPVTVSQSICSQPAYEADWVRVELPQTMHFGFSLSWQTSDDLDIVMYDASGRSLVAITNNANPKQRSLESLAAGVYFFRIVRASGGTAATTVTPYDLVLSAPECTNFFHCTNPTLPVCTNGTCTGGFGECDPPEDTLRENGDDGSAGAVDATPPFGVSTMTTGNICNNPDEEIDSFFVSVDPSDNLQISLSWTSTTVDLDLYVYHRDGPQTEKLVGASYLSNPETVTLTNLPAGEVVIVIDYFGDITRTTEPYTVELLKTAGGCLSSADCAIEYQTQLFRGECLASGACDFIDGSGALGLADLCDSDDDCSSGLCSYVSFESDAEASVCSLACTQDADCMQLGFGYVCSDSVVAQPRRCVPACTNDLECGTRALPPPDPGLPWDYFTCNTNTGVCSN